MNAKKRQAYIDSIEFKFSALPEDIGPEDELEGEALKWVTDEIDNGNEAAWFCAKVTGYLTIGDLMLIAEDHLSGCSYRSFQQFKEDAYYYDMQRCVREELTAKLDVLIEKLCA